MINSIPILIAQAAESTGFFERFPLAYLLIAISAAGYFALQYGVLKNKGIAAVGGLLIAGSVATAAWTQASSLENVILLLFVGLAVFGCVNFVTLREPVYAALGFATAVLSSCGVLFMQYAYFVSAATMIVYAGATIIIFLFVLMFAQKENLQTYDLKLNSPLTAAVVAGIVLSLLYYGISNLSLAPVSKDLLASRSYTAVAEQGDAPAKTAELGRGLYTDYLFTVAIAGTLLLVATIGAIGVASRTLEPDTP